MAFETGSVANYSALFDLLRAKLTSTAFMGAGNEWAEIVYDMPAGEIKKRLFIKNTGESGQDEIWLMFQEHLSSYDSQIAGFYINGALGYNPLTPGWSGILSPMEGGNGGFMALPNTGIADRDEIKYWLVADRKRVILAVHTEYKLGGGQVMWFHNGYVSRWDPPSQYPTPHLRSTPQQNASRYTSGGQSLGYQSAGYAKIPNPIYQQVVNAEILTLEPPSPNPNGSHVLLPMWVFYFQEGTGYYAGEVDGLFYTDASVGHGNTFEVGGVTHVCLQNYLPGHYVALRLS